MFGYEEVAVAFCTICASMPLEKVLALVATVIDWWIESNPGTDVTTVDCWERLKAAAEAYEAVKKIVRDRKDEK